MRGTCIWAESHRLKNSQTGRINPGGGSERAVLARLLLPPLKYPWAWARSGVTQLPVDDTMFVLSSFQKRMLCRLKRHQWWQWEDLLSWLTTCCSQWNDHRHANWLGYVTTALQTFPVNMFKAWNWSKHISLILRMQRCSEQRWMDKYSTALQGFVDFFLPLWALTDITLQRSTVLSSTEAVKDIHNDENMAFQSTWHGFTNTAVWHQECDHSMLRTQWQQLGFTLSALYITYSFVIANYKILI